jgi:FMN reductase
VIVKVIVVVGNPKSKSRTLKVAVALARELFSPGERNCQVIDLVEHVDDIFDSSSDDLAAISASVAASDLVVFASPTNKATYTGLLKAFLDRYPVNGLSCCAAISVIAGSDLSHSMGPAVTLGPVLVELGATVPGLRGQPNGLCRRTRREGGVGVSRQHPVHRGVGNSARHQNSCRRRRRIRASTSMSGVSGRRLSPRSALEPRFRAAAMIRTIDSGHTMCLVRQAAFGDSASAPARRADIAAEVRS